VVDKALYFITGCMKLHFKHTKTVVAESIQGKK